MWHANGVEEGIFRWLLGCDKRTSRRADLSVGGFLHFPQILLKYITCSVTVW